jgi:valyl-tRNA synthetase
MSLPKRYDHKKVEPRLATFWESAGVYQFVRDETKEVFSIDTPPPTVSGNLHMGHAYSYTHPDFIARFFRMRGKRVFYPMGYDDNGLPTDRLVEKRLGVNAKEVGRSAFRDMCLALSEQAEREYQALWKQLGLSVDWRYTYRTIDERSRRVFQLCFLHLYQKGLVYRANAPAIWCPECQTSIAQAELNDMERQTEFFTLAFRLEDGTALPIATTRPELLPACVAVFVHPQDGRYTSLIGQKAFVPLAGREVPILTDAAANPEKGTGAVMCCTFGDATDVAWWRTHGLPLMDTIGKDGRMSAEAGKYAGLAVLEARRAMVQDLQVSGLLLTKQPALQSVRVHERCDTPVEYVVARQWFVRLLENKPQLLEGGDQVEWHPPHMRSRYHRWVENLNWDWCITRQRQYGVEFPVWYCQTCGQAVLASERELPINPMEKQPGQVCQCGSEQFIPEEDVLDTWAISSLSPQIVGGWLDDPDLYEQVFPFSLRPQSHEIIRTWAFYTIAQSLFHFDVLPWKHILISGWGIAGEGMGKISKSRGGGPMHPREMIEIFSADAVRYWASGTGPGKDTVISIEKIQNGQKLINKLWNVARFAERFLKKEPVPAHSPHLSAADRWILARMQRLIRRVTDNLEGYDYAAARSEIENFFYRELADNYLEMAKQRLYDVTSPYHASGKFTLQQVLLALLKLFAPFFPFVTEEIYLGLFQDGSSIEGPITLERKDSIHTSGWPVPDPLVEDGAAEQFGELLVDIATAVRRYKSAHSLALGSTLHRLQLAVADPNLEEFLKEAAEDLGSITRAGFVEVVTELTPAFEEINITRMVRAAIEITEQTQNKEQHD